MNEKIEQNLFQDYDFCTAGIPDSVKKEVYRRDNNRCQISGRTDNLSIHHIKKDCDGGEAMAHNLILVNREVHDWLHFARIPEKVYEIENYFILSRMNILRDFMLIKVPPKKFETAYEYVRAMFDAIDTQDDNPPNPKGFSIDWTESKWMPSNPWQIPTTAPKIKFVPFLTDKIPHYTHYSNNYYYDQKPYYSTGVYYDNGSNYTYTISY